ncbi:MAG TPA: hypothetical protein VGD01_17015 [Candidatus Elarobacter sp.]
MEAPREPARRRGLRRPKALNAPKRRAFRIDDGDAVEAARALNGAGLYEYGRRPVHRKRLPGATATDDKSWYFAFDPHRRGVPSLVGTGEAMTPAHAMMQAVVWEKRFVQCTIDGAVFTAELTDAERASARRGDDDILRRRRRPDVGARAVRATDRRLNGRPLDVEIAVTGPGRPYDRLGEMIVTGRACLELLVPRDEALEADPNVLEAHLRAGLVSGAFTARWIVAPDGHKALVKSVADVRDLLDKQRLLAEDEVAAARSELASARELMRASEDVREADDAGDASALARVRADRDALLELVEAEYRDHDTTSLIWLIAARVMPSLREPRLRTRALRLAAIRAEIRARFAPKRGRVLRHVEAFDRAMHAPMSEEAARRAEAESLAAVAAASLRHAEERVARVEEYRGALDELEAAGSAALLFPPGSTLRATIAYEYRRRFGAPAAETKTCAPSA